MKCSILFLIQKVKRNGGEHRQLKAYDAFKLDDEPDADFLILSPTKAYLESEKPTERDIHDQCLVLRMEYKGKSILFTGDSSMEAWKERIVPYYSDKSGRPNLLKSNILHVSHHGSYTFFKPKGDKEAEPYTEALNKIDPKISIITVGADNPHGHPDEEALELYKQYTFNKQVFMTKDHGSLFVKIEDNGDYSIETEKMIISKTLPTIATVDITVSPLPENDGFYNKSVDIDFKAVIKKLPKNQTAEEFTWIVQNNAIGDDEHHDWYIGQKNEQKLYQNMTAYTGSHTLLCEVRNKRKNIIATKAIQVKVE